MPGRIEWVLGPRDQRHPIEVFDRDGHMVVSWRDGQPPTPGMIQLLNALTNIIDDFFRADEREGPPQTS